MNFPTSNKLASETQTLKKIKAWIRRSEKTQNLKTDALKFEQ